MITVADTILPGVKAITRSLSGDHRGFYAEIYDKEKYSEHGIKVEFKEDCFSFSRKNVIRGIHVDPKTWKLISCQFGVIFLVVINYDCESPFFGKFLTFTLTPVNRLQILVPPKYGNGHLVQSEWAIFHYKQSEIYDGGKRQETIKWNDSRFNIPWPVKEPILSRRDGAQFWQNPIELIPE